MRSLLIFLVIYASYLHGEPSIPLIYEQTLGFKTLGVSGDVVLVKENATNKVTAFKAGSNYLNQFTILAVEDRRFKIKNLSSSKISWVVRDPVLDSPVAPLIRDLPKSLDEITSRYSEPGFKREKGDVEMTEEYRGAIIGNLGTILMQASTDPVIKNGQIIGFMLDDIDVGSIYNKSGFVDQDIITKINDEPLNDASKALRILNQLKNAKNIDVELLRGGATMHLTVSVK